MQVFKMSHSFNVLSGIPERISLPVVLGGFDDRVKAPRTPGLSRYLWA